MLPYILLIESYWLDIIGGTWRISGWNFEIILRRIGYWMFPICTLGKSFTSFEWPCISLSFINLWRKYIHYFKSTNNCLRNRIRGMSLTLLYVRSWIMTLSVKKLDESWSTIPVYITHHQLCIKERPPA